jgi:hypothetical protein
VAEDDVTPKAQLPGAKPHFIYLGKMQTGECVYHIRRRGFAKS